VDLGSDHRVVQTIHYAREILVPPRTEAERVEGVPELLDRSEILRARVHRVDGTLAFAEEQRSSEEGVRVIWPPLHRGDVVEVAIRTATAGPIGRRGDVPFYFLDTIGGTTSHPSLYSEVVVRSPVQFPLFVDVIRGQPDLSEKQTSNGFETHRFAWNSPPVVPEEPHALPLTFSAGGPFRIDAFEQWYGGWRIHRAGRPDYEACAGDHEGQNHEEHKIVRFTSLTIRYVNYVSGNGISIAPKRSSVESKGIATTRPCCCSHSFGRSESRATKYWYRLGIRDLFHRYCLPRSLFPISIMASRS
jgi:hypothetical protein